ncbi:DivIVA domain-containing protein [Nocardia sp. NPDC055321]
MDVTPDEIRSATFKGARLGRRGYDAEEVDRFLERVHIAVARVARENRQLTLTSNSPELARLQRENMQLAGKSEAMQLQMQTMASAGEVAELQRQLANANWEIARLQEETAKDALGISNQAVETLKRAQASADSIVAQAEEHARELMRVTRAQQREMLQQVMQAGPQRGAYTDPEQEDQRLAQLQSYSGLLRNQLQAMIMTLSVEVDKLALLPLSGTSEALPDIVPASAYPRDLPIGGTGHPPRE